MISFTFYKNKDGYLTGFLSKNHGQDIVCAAVSVLTQNTANSIEAFSDAEFVLEYEEQGGYMELHIKKNIDNNARLLLDSLFLGISGIKEEYGDEIDLIVKEVL